MIAGSLARPVQVPAFTRHAGAGGAQRRSLVVRAAVLELPDSISKVQNACDDNALHILLFSEPQLNSPDSLSEIFYR